MDLKFVSFIIGLLRLVKEELLDDDKKEEFEKVEKVVGTAVGTIADITGDEVPEDGVEPESN